MKRSGEGRASSLGTTQITVEPRMQAPYVYTRINSETWTSLAYIAPRDAELRSEHLLFSRSRSNDELRMLLEKIVFNRHPSDMATIALLIIYRMRQNLYIAEQLGHEGV